MARKKARLTENDPLESKTDSILSSFSATEQVNKSKSREPNNPTREEVNNLGSQKVRHFPTETSQSRTISQSDKSNSQEELSLTSQEVEKLTTQQSNNLTTQKVTQSIKLKKATYKLSEDVIERLDRAYLQMSLERGRKNTPYKEVLVEEAIASFLDRLEENPDLVEQVLIRQDGRG